ncbi:hypothetical protein F5882DRAFT_409843 [Hyaloscypha sp. PMI_1271]|nr:hypothetical protein F5882DRAFT_409843 [Hyaloscypha sp. PMI_1271]
MLPPHILHVGLFKTLQTIVLILLLFPFSTREASDRHPRHRLVRLHPRPTPLLLSPLHYPSNHPPLVPPHHGPHAPPRVSSMRHLRLQDRGGAGQTVGKRGEAGEVSGEGGAGGSWGEESLV